jgi:UDP-galactopyranose mutase
MSTEHLPIQKNKRQLESVMRLKIKPDLVCFSHLRWDFVHQRPQHLLTRAVADRRVFFVEEPVFDNGTMHLEMNEREGGIQLVVPHLPSGLHSEVAGNAVLKDLVQRLFDSNGIQDYICWYYTPMALMFTSHLNPRAIVYDCMDELSAFKGAPANLKMLENELFRRADLVFTGGQSLFESKRERHRSVYCFPSSIDRDHFNRARELTPEPEDQKEIPHPRLGFFGVVDERFDIELLRRAANARPDWHFVVIGPVVKIDPTSLPNNPNIHYLGPKSYQSLPAYISGWDLALLPFAVNESTRFISPTKTPEYLAAGKRVVSTPIADVIQPWGDLNLVTIANGADEFIAVVEELLQKQPDDENWIERVDAFLSGMSWDLNWSRMSKLIDDVLEKGVSGKAVKILNQKATSTA